MNCPNCSHTNLQGAQFCGNCGFAFIQQAQQTPVAMQPQPLQPPAPPLQQPVNAFPIQNPQPSQAFGSTQQPPPPQPAPSQPQYPAATPQPQAQAYPPNTLGQQYQQPVQPSGSALPLLIGAVANLVIPTAVSQIANNDSVALIMGLISLVALIILFVLTKKARARKQQYSEPAFIVVGITVGLILLGFVLGAVNGFNKASERGKNKESNSQSSISKTRYPQAAKTAFIDNCSKTLAESVCECTYNKIQDNIGYEEFIDAEDELKKSGILPPALEQKVHTYAQECANNN